MNARDEASPPAQVSVDDGNEFMPFHRNPPQPNPVCLYGLIGDVAIAGSEGTETNPYAIAANFMTYLSCAIGRGPYLPIGNTLHHTRVYSLHMGRSGRGRKGDALSLVMRIDEALRGISSELAPQIHQGGLSTREGLVALIHDGYRQGLEDIPAIEDKRLWIVESEFANVLHQARRGGNTLSTALRDCWDGVSLKPATKSNRLYASHPHLCLSGAISPTELLGLLSNRDLTNGFANRFMMIWAERSQILPFPKTTSQATIDSLAQRLVEILDFAGANQYQRGNCLRVELSEGAKCRYDLLYRGELNHDSGSNLVDALIERQAPMLLRLAMLFALTDEQCRIDVHHIEAAMGWIRFTLASVKFVFVNAANDEKMARMLELSNRILSFLNGRHQVSRRELNVECFKGHVAKAQIDTAIEYLLMATPPKISVHLLHRPQGVPGTPTRIYRLAEPRS